MDRSGPHRSDLRDLIVVRDRAGRTMAEWHVEPGAEVTSVEPFVRRGVADLGWTMHRRALAVGSLPLPEVPAALPPPGEPPEKDREG